MCLLANCIQARTGFIWPFDFGQRRVAVRKARFVAAKGSRACSETTIVRRHE
jgi:hypothetical protein